MELTLEIDIIQHVSYSSGNLPKCSIQLLHPETPDMNNNFVYQHHQIRSLIYDAMSTGKTSITYTFIACIVICVHHLFNM